MVSQQYRIKTFPAKQRVPLVSNDSQTVGGPAHKNMNKTSAEKKKRFEPVNQANDDEYFTAEVGITVSQGQRTS